MRPGRDNGIRRCEPANRRIEPARAVEIKPKLGLFPLTGKLVVRAERAGGEARLAEGFVQRGGGLDSARVRCHRRTAEVVAEQVRQRPVRADGETRRASKVVLGDDSIGHLVVIAHEVGGHAVDGLGYAVAVAVIHKRGRDGIQGRHGQNFEAQRSRQRRQGRRGSKDALCGGSRLRGADNRRILDA